MWRFDCCYCYLDTVTLPWDLKLKRGGRGRPLGRRVFGSLNSSKNGCMQASIWRMILRSEHIISHSISICTLWGNKNKWSCGLTAVHRRSGEYCRNLLTRSIASGGSFFWKTWIQTELSGNRGMMRKYVGLIFHLSLYMIHRWLNILYVNYHFSSISIFLSFLTIYQHASQKYAPN